MKNKTKISDGISLREFARRQRISHVSAQNWAEAGLPVKADGKIDPVAGANWAKKYRRLETEAAQHGELTLAEAVRRKEVALMGIREIELAEKAGLVVAIEDASRVFGAAISNARARLLQLPSAAALDLAVESDPKAVEAILKKLVYDALTELAYGSAPNPGGASA